MIRDRQHPERADWQVTAPWPKLTIARDYALVSRVFDRATGTLVVSGAGITPYGTTAAAEFLTSPQHLEAALRNAPPDWPTRTCRSSWKRASSTAPPPPRMSSPRTSGGPRMTASVGRRGARPAGATTALAAPM